MNCPLSSVNYPLNTIGQIERATQNRVVKLFREQMKYDYLGNWEERPNNRNIEEKLLRTSLHLRGYDAAIITKALYELNKTAGDQTKSLYDLNKEVYGLLRYGVKVKPDVGENTVTVWLIDWKNPDKNDFAIAEEVTVTGGEHTKRPDVVIYVNGIALGVLELKRSTVSVAEGIRQNLDNQKPIFIERFFTTMQLNGSSQRDCLPAGVESGSTYTTLSGFTVTGHIVKKRSPPESKSLTHICC